MTRSQWRWMLIGAVAASPLCVVSFFAALRLFAWIDGAS